MRANSSISVRSSQKREIGNSFDVHKVLSLKNNTLGSAYTMGDNLAIDSAILNITGRLKFEEFDADEKLYKAKAGTKARELQVRLTKRLKGITD